MTDNKSTSISSTQEAEAQIYEKRKDVKYDTRDLTVELIVKKYISSLDTSDYMSDLETDDKYNRIFVPEYQRDFTWDNNRQSRFIESIILGLPIPFIFVAENRDSSWEIVDGSQRIRTLHNFITNNLQLCKLTSLDKLNNYKFDNLDKTRKSKLLNTALRLIVLSEETTDDIKKDMFERINLGSDILKPMEKRNGIYPGPFRDFIYDFCKTNEDFRSLLLLDKWLEKRQEREELLLRFFALSDNNSFERGISVGLSSYLDSYISKKNLELSQLTPELLTQEISRLSSKICKTIQFVKNVFPFGFRHAHNPQTKRSVFEAIAIGSHIFLESQPESDVTAIDYNKFDKNLIGEKLKEQNFKKFTHVASELHQRAKLAGRVNYIAKMLESMYQNDCQH